MDSRESMGRLFAMDCGWRFLDDSRHGGEFPVAFRNVLFCRRENHYNRSGLRQSLPRDFPEKGRKPGRRAADGRKERVMRRGLGHPDHAEKPAAKPRAPARRSGAGGDDEPLTVGELTRRIKALLENAAGTLTVAGEVSGIKASPSGHIYFALKDSLALIDCVIWRSAAERIGELPGDGAKVAVRGRLSVYEPRGRYQLTVTSFVADGGKGDLWRRFEEVRERLTAEGLFDQERKRPLPASPRVLGIVTSPSGAALRDILKILGRRAPDVRLVVSPCLVQGREAAADIVRALAALYRWGEADAIIVARGGGSLEDLWPFNEEIVARAIVASPVPVVSAVGHETDFSIADFAADVRAATPSEAAERIAPDRSALRGRMLHVARALARSLAGLTRERRERLIGAARRAVFRRPLDMFMPKWQGLDETAGRLGADLEERLRRAASRLELAGARLEGLSPRKILERGYAVVLDADGAAVTDASSLTEGTEISALLHKGGFLAKVVETTGEGRYTGEKGKENPRTATD